MSAIERTSTALPAAATPPLTVLFVSPINEDQIALQTIVDRSKWLLYSAHDLVTAFPLLQQHEIAVVLCEENLKKKTWVELLEHVAQMPKAPSLIVASGLADERLWAKALNLGAWDVLAKPFDRTEVIRCIKSGWQHWHDLIRMRSKGMKPIAAAG